MIVIKNDKLIVMILTIISISCLSVSLCLFISSHFLFTISKLGNDYIIYFFDSIASLTFVMDVCLFIGISLVILSIISIIVLYFVNTLQIHF